MINLHIVSPFSYNVLGFDNEEFVSLHLADFDAVRVSRDVWELSDGSMAALSEKALENFLILEKV